MGFVGAVILYRVPALEGKLRRVPDSLRTLVLIPFLAPPLALPLLPQPRLAWPPIIGWLTGVSSLILAAVVGFLAMREIGVRPSWGEPKGLVTTGIYGVVRHPYYLSLFLFAVGWAVYFQAVYALLFVPVLVISYVAIICMEEQGLQTEYGDDYQEYAERVPWRLIPRVF